MSIKVKTYQQRQPTIWEENCRLDCEVFDQCGGTFTSPCGCVRRGINRFNCSDCNIICRDRNAPSKQHIAKDTFLRNITDGLNVEDISINQKTSDTPFPVLIPTKTHRLKSKLNTQFIGIQLDQIITKAQFPSLRIGVHPKTNPRKYFNCTNRANFIAILNTNDKYLEAFWRMPDRNLFYDALKRLGIEYVTGPTFSVVEEMHSMPASHNVAMLLRHNRIVQEIYDHGFIPIPNIYWRSEIDIDNWIAWIATNNSVEYITRDLSMVAKGEKRSYIIPRFLKFLESINRPLHVLFTGVGIVNAKYLMKEFNNLIHSCSFISSEPIISAMIGGKKLNPFRSEYLKEHKRDRNELADYNLRIFEDLLLQQLPEINHEQLNFFNGS